MPNESKSAAREVDWEVLPPGTERKRGAVEPIFRLVALLMDNLVPLPGVKRRIGLNPLIDLIPGVGDVSAAVVSTSVLLYGLRHGLPKVLLARMGLNILINETVGAVPIVGSAFAFWFRANLRNYELLRTHAGAPEKRRASDWIFVVGILVLIIAIIVGGLVVSLLIVDHLLRLLTTR